MKLKIERCGDDLMVLLSNDLVAALGVKIGDSLDMEVVDGCIVIHLPPEHDPAELHRVLKAPRFFAGSDHA